MFCSVLFSSPDFCGVCGTLHLRPDVNPNLFVVYDIPSLHSRLRCPLTGWDLPSFLPSLLPSFISSFPQELLDGTRVKIDVMAVAWTPEEKQACLEETMNCFRYGGSLMGYMRPPAPAGQGGGGGHGHGH